MALSHYRVDFVQKLNSKEESKLQNTSIIIKFYEKYMLVMGSMGHIGFLLQAFKVFSTGRAHDLSLPGFLVVFVSLLSWLFYGILIKDKVLIIVNIIGILCSTLTIVAILTAAW